MISVSVALACCRLSIFRNFLECLHGKRNLAILDADDLDFDFVADIQHFLRMFQSLSVGDLRDMNETVDTVAE